MKQHGKTRFHGPTQQRFCRSLHAQNNLVPLRSCVSELSGHTKNVCAHRDPRTQGPVDGVCSILDAKAARGRRSTTDSFL